MSLAQHVINGPRGADLETILFAIPKSRAWPSRCNVLYRTQCLAMKIDGRHEQVGTPHRYLAAWWS